MSLYVPILREALRRALHERRLWGHAFFGGMLVGTGLLGGILQAFDADPIQQFVRTLIDSERGVLTNIPNLWLQARTTGTTATISLILYGGAVLAGASFIIWSAVRGMNQVIVSVDAMHRGQSLNRQSTSTHGRFWSTCATHILLRAVSMILIATWTTILTTSASTTGSPMRTIITFTVTVLLLTVLQWMIPLTIASIVLDERSPMEALHEAAALIRSSWLILVEASVILAGANIIAATLWMIGSFLLALPFVFLGGIAIAQGVAILATIALAAGLLLLTVGLVVVTMIYGTFLLASWTLLSLRLTGRGEEPTPWMLRRFGPSA